MFVGMHDRSAEGVWRFPSNEYFDPNSDGTLFGWESNEPNNNHGDENCVLVKSNQKLNDCFCYNPLHGICEVKVYDC